jgi:hypothetical protein
MPIRSQPRATVEQAERWLATRAVARPDDVRAYTRELWRLAPQVGLDPCVLYSQAVHETAGFASRAWEGRLNPAGIGITDGADLGYCWQNGTDAARAHIVHMDVYVNGVPRSPISGDVLAPYYHLDPRRDAAIAAGWAGTVRTIRDLTGKWATDPDYHNKIVRWPATLFGELLGGTTMPITIGVPVVRNLLSATAPNRPGTKLAQSGNLYIVVHETGNTNPSADAPSQIAYLQTAEARQRQVSYHLAVDDVQIVQGLPLDEIGWHAGDGCDNPQTDIGCYRSVAIEKCVNAENDPVRKERTRRNLAECIARIVRGDPAFDWGSGSSRGRFSVDRILQHRQVSDERKWCPAHILNDGFWPTLMQWVQDIYDRWPNFTGPAPSPAITYPAGMDEGIASWLFGSLTKNGKTYRFNPRGPVSQTWLRYGAARGYSQIIDVWKFDDGREYFRFASFTLWRPNAKSEFRPLEGA